jgi:hypothetical protein
MVASGGADARKTAVWTGLDALGRSRPHLLLDGETPNTYVARWRSSAVPAHVLAGRLRGALPGSKVLAVRSLPGRPTVKQVTQNGRSGARHHITIEFAVQPDAAPEGGKPCAEG